MHLSQNRDLPYKSLPNLTALWEPIRLPPLGASSSTVKIELKLCWQVVILGLLNFLEITWIQAGWVGLALRLSRHCWYDVLWAPSFDSRLELAVQLLRIDIFIANCSLQHIETVHISFKCGASALLSTRRPEWAWWSGSYRPGRPWIVIWLTSIQHH